MMVLDPIASLRRQSLVFRAEQRPEAELAPRLARRLPTGGYAFVDSVRQRLALIAGATLAPILPEGGTPPRFDLCTDRIIRAQLQHPDPAAAAAQLAQRLWRLGQPCRVEPGALGQINIRLQRLPISLRFLPDRRALIRHLHHRLEGRAGQAQLGADALSCRLTQS